MMNIGSYIDELTTKGRYHFLTAEAVAAVGS